MGINYVTLQNRSKGRVTDICNLELSYSILGRGVNSTWKCISDIDSNSHVSLNANSEINPVVVVGHLMRNC